MSASRPKRTASRTALVVVTALSLLSLHTGGAVADGRSAPSASIADTGRLGSPPSMESGGSPGTPLVARRTGSGSRTVAKLPEGTAAVTLRLNEKKLRARLLIKDTTVLVGKKVVVSTKGSRARRGLDTLIIRWGDGSRSRAAKVTVTRKHVYKKAGTYTIRLKIVDRAGKVARNSQGVFIAKKAIGGYGAQWPNSADAVTIPVDTAPGAPGAGAAPSSWDLRSSAVAVGNQGQIGSCVAWTTAYAMMGWYYKKQTGTETKFAPMYVYSQRHGALDAKGLPTGFPASEALDVLRDQGVDTAAHYGAGWATDWQTRPNASQTANAANFRITGSNAIFRHTASTAVSVGPNAVELELLKARLAAGNPVAIAFRVRKSFETYSSGWYDGSGALTGGLHEMLALGYNSTGLFIQNSWGTALGVQGYVFMTWAAVQRDLYEAMFADGAVFTNGTPTDTTKPTITSFSQKFAVNYIANNAQAPMTFTWAGSDNVGVKQYLLYYRVGGGDWYQLSINPLQTSVTYNLGFGSNYEFAVAAYDTSGNLSDWTLSGLFTPANFDESVASYTGSWAYFDNTSYMNGRAAVTSQAGSQMSVFVTAKSFGLVGTQWSGAGAADVYLDDVYQFTIDNYSSSTRYRDVLAWFNFVDSVQHKITLVAQGTAGRPPVDVDSFLVT